MSESRDSQEALIERLRADMPPAPSEDAACKVRARVLSSRPMGKAPAVRRPWRLAGGFAAAAAVLTLAAVVAAPQMETVAFARERAVEALTFQVPGRVLHLEMTYTQEDHVDGAVQTATSERWSVWVDAEGKRLRDQFVNSADGSLSELHVRTPERDIVFHPSYPAEARLVEYDARNQRIGTALDDWIPYMRARIADGSAKVTGTEVIDGDEYWLVVCDADDPHVKQTVTLRKSDYLLKTWVREVASDDAGKSKVVKSATLHLIEQLDPATLPSDFFSVDVVKDAAKRGAVR